MPSLEGLQPASEATRDHDQSAVDQPVTELNLAENFQFQIDEIFKSSY